MHFYPRRGTILLATPHKYGILNFAWLCCTLHQVLATVRHLLHPPDNSGEYNTYTDKKNKWIKSKYKYTKKPNFVAVTRLGNLLPLPHNH